MTSSFPLFHPKVSFWKRSTIQRLHLQPVRSTECCSKKAEIPGPRQFKSPEGWFPNYQGCRLFLIFRSQFSIYAIFTQGVGQSTAADLDNQQDWATNVPLPSSASATRKRELLIIASVAIITTVMAILPNSTITVVRISVYHQPQVWWPLLKSEPYFLNCPWFLLAGGYTTQLNFKFQVVLY